MTPLSSQSNLALVSNDLICKNQRILKFVHFALKSLLYILVASLDCKFINVKTMA